MAYTRKVVSGGTSLIGFIKLQSDGKYQWQVNEKFTTDELTTLGGTKEGVAWLATGNDVADYDTAAAQMKSAWDAAQS